MTAPQIVSSTLVVGMEVHVELSTRRKMFSGAPSPAAAGGQGFGEHDAPPNSLLDPVVLGLPGALPVMNRAAVEMSMLVGLALNCSIGRRPVWDRKSYFYPDMPKAYQISQYQLPLCFDGSFDLPAPDERGFPDPARPGARIGIIRAHLEEDAGKLLHDAPGGGAIDFSILDLNRAGTPLLEIVTHPDFRSAEQCVLFAKLLRATCRLLGVTEGDMQRGHMRFEPNINCVLALADGREVRTPIVEVKNLNSFRSLKGAIEFEHAEQPRRWLADRREMGPGAKVTRGWDDARAVTFPQREKEDAHDYRYFPDPDLPPVAIDDDWRERVRLRVPELPAARLRRYTTDANLPAKEAFALIDEPDTCRFYEDAVDALVALDIERSRAGKLAANWVLGACAKRANERGGHAHDVGLSPACLAGIAKLREDARLSNQGADELFTTLCDLAAHERDPREALALAERVAAERALLIVRDDAALGRWIEQVFAANPKVVDDVRGGKVAAAGRLVGEVMKLAGGTADAKGVREEILRRLGQNPG
ncbi:MAG: Asp-tRNA(Asn)/Glu-tRNA(Gln) amidotransferase subunit GatB [Planctomycetota bacterium]|nr:Asp-tRNA(Asn)/Glu-tRNA(Gln) amidotransferase subunit GatB [Planctomycetota bacterium]